ncbi:hypothetical protein LUZ62_052709 [Rhynchospora pubera]|uniref:DUF4220 domain-containing protein n=1 Tax=Rhynchospora pubera TaxID=906938 RepID=A0AAV8G700_9POAL|nr:hypothetical protein LUZ62_052709 [Rhynchospora pubera]
MNPQSSHLAPPSKMLHSLEKLWNKLEIRVLVISSLSLQILLLGLAGFRKHAISSRWAETTARTWQGPLFLMFHWLLWLAYLLADYVATVALAYLPDGEINKANPQSDQTQHLFMFWAPFFLLHLGGQDTITALSVEDNELWARHLLTLLSQVALAGYNYFSANLHVSALWPPAALMFVVACFKYGERIYSLQRASMSALRSSMITKPDPGPNYAKFMQEYTSSIRAGLSAVIKVEVEKHESVLESRQTKSSQSKPTKSSEIREEVDKLEDDLESQQTKESVQIKPTESEETKGEVNNQEDGVKSLETKKFKRMICKPRSREGRLRSKEYADTVYKAYKFFPTFKRLFVDLILSYKDREDSQKYFEDLKFEQAYKLIEIELSWMYDILHSKASLIFAYKHYGWLSRMFTLVITTVALVLFAISDHSVYGHFEIILTYVLLGGAVGLEIIAFAYMLLSFWTYAVIRDSKKESRRDFREESGYCKCSVEDFLFRVQEMIRPMEKSRWSDKMAQYSLITYSLEDQPSQLKPIMKDLGLQYIWDHLYATSIAVMKFFGLKETWDHYRYATYVTVSDALKRQVFQELIKKMKSIEDRASYKRITEHRGQWALQRMGYYQEFGWSVDAEFDESILLWHIATDLLFHEENCTTEDRLISQHISNYMLFLLIVRPFMMPAGIGQIRFGDTCAEARNFLQSEGSIKKCDAVKKILGVSTEYDPGLVKGDRSKSVLFNGCRLTHQLKKEFTDDDKQNREEYKKVNWDRMWRLIRAVWVEMLCYAASKCRGQYHAKQLRKGGELLTVVWFLMAHLGMGEQYRIEEGHARAKLIVAK